MQGKERLPVSLSSPMHPPHQNKSPFPSRSGGHPRSEPRIRTQWTGYKPAAPLTERRRRAGSGGLVLGRGGRMGGSHPAGHSELASRSIWGGHLLAGSWAARLGEQSCRKPSRGGALARATQSGGCTRGAGGPRTKAPGRARLAVCAAVPEPRDFQLSVCMGEGAREETPRLENVIS